MKKLLFSGLTALMMLFSFAHAQNRVQAKAAGDPDTVSIVIQDVSMTEVTSWTMGTDAPKVAVNQSRADGSSLSIGASENDYAVLVILQKDDFADTNLFTSAMFFFNSLKTDNLTAGEWNCSYVLVKGNSTLEAPVALEEGKAIIDTKKSTAKLTVIEITDDVPEDDENAPAITFSPANTEEVESNQEIELNYEAGAFVDVVWKTFATIKEAKTEEPSAYWTVYEDEMPQVTVEEPVLVIAGAVKAIGSYEYKYYRVYNVKAAVVTEVATPTFAMETDNTPVSVSGTCQIVEGGAMFINCATTGAQIRYTIDDSDIMTEESGLEYTGFIPISKPCTLKAKAFVGEVASEQAEIKVLLRRDSIKVSLSAAKWEMGKTVPRVTVSINAIGSSLKMGSGEDNMGLLAILKKDGVAKDTQLITAISASLKTDSLTVGEWTLEYVLVKGNSTVKAPVALDRDVVLATASATLTVEKGTVAKPTFNPRAGEVDANTLLAINCTTPGAKVYYTVDGTTPTESSELYNADTKVLITEAVKIKAYAVKDGWYDSPVDSAAYTIAVLPEDEEGAPAVTFTPGDADSVDNNTEIFVSTQAEGYQIMFGTFASIASAKQASLYSLESYGSDGYPVVTEKEPVLLVVLVKMEDDGSYEQYKYFRYYKVRKASVVDMPMFMAATGVQGGFVPKGTRLQIIAEQGTIWYTTDGSRPAVDGATSIKGEMEGEEGAGANLTIDSSMTVKAIVVVNGVSSDVAITRFKLFEDIDATLKIGLMNDTLVGKNAPAGVTMVSETLGEAISEYIFTNPFTVYYTLDGQTEPSEEAYWEQEDPENGVIKKVATVMGEGGYPVMDDYGNVVALMFSEGTEVHLKAKGYLMLGETAEAGQIISALFDKKIKVKSEENPTFSIVPDSKVNVDDTLIIRNLGSEDAMSTLYFSFDGTKPTSADYFAQEYGKPYSIFKTPFEGQDIKIIFGEDEKGFYAYVPTIFDLMSNHKQDTVRFENDYFSVQVLCVSAMETGNYSGWGRPEMMPYGSDFVKASYFSKVPDTVKAPTFSVAAGEVEKGTEVELASETEDAKIYYTTNGDAPTEASTLYENKIAINASMTIKAIAVKEGMIRSKVSEVAYTVKEEVEPDTVKAPTFSVPAGEVEEGTEVELASETEGAKIYYTVDGTVPTAESTEYTAAISIDKAMTIKAIAVMEGMVNSKVAEASYTIKVANEGKELAGVSLYPNPTEGEFYVSVPVNANVEIFTVNGILVNRFDMVAGKQNVRLPNSGIYFVRFTAENGQVAVRRVIVR